MTGDVAFAHLVRLLDRILRQGEGEVMRFLLLRRPVIGPGLDSVKQDIARAAKPGGGPEVVKPSSGIGEFVKD